MIKPYCVPVPGAEMIRECYHAGVWWDDLNEIRDSVFCFLFFKEQCVATRYNIQ